MTPAEAYQKAMEALENARREYQDKVSSIESLERTIQQQQEKINALEKRAIEHQQDILVLENNLINTKRELQENQIQQNTNLETQRQSAQVRADEAVNLAKNALAERSISLGFNNLLGCTLSDAFSYNGRTMGHYSLTWGMDSWQNNGPTAWFSAYGGIKLFTDGRERVSINIGGEIRYHVSLQHSSSRELKDNIVDFSAEEAVEIVEKLNPVSYSLKTDEDKRLHIGFIAEDVPQAIASHDRKAISNDNIVAVLTKVVKEQQKTITALQKDIQSLNANTAQEQELTHKSNCIRGSRL